MGNPQTSSGVFVGQRLHARMYDEAFAFIVGAGHTYAANKADIGLHEQAS
jgi:hypothetical protein